MFCKYWRMFVRMMVKIVVVMMMVIKVVARLMEMLQVVMRMVIRLIDWFYAVWGICILTDRQYCTEQTVQHICKICLGMLLTNSKLWGVGRFGKFPNPFLLKASLNENISFEFDYFVFGKVNNQINESSSE